jgi:hypothetical protein
MFLQMRMGCLVIWKSRLSLETVTGYSGNGPVLPLTPGCQPRKPKFIGVSFAFQVLGYASLAERLHAVTFATLFTACYTSWTWNIVSVTILAMGVQLTSRRHSIQANPRHNSFQLEKKK